MGQVLQPRVLRGNGKLSGRFSNREYAEADVELADAAALLDSAHRSAHIASRRLPSIDVEDVAQQAIVQYLEHQARATVSTNGLTAATTAKKDKDRDAYLHVTARNIATRTAFNVTRSEDFAALRELHTTRDATELELQRQLTETEVVDLAHRIRMSRPPMRRPSPDFHQLRKEVLIPEVHYEARPKYTAVVNGDDFAPDTVGDRAMQLLDDRTAQRNIRTARALAWTALAERAGAPNPVAHSISAGRATTLRAQVKDAGGVSALVTKFNNATITEHESSALFAPFGDITTDERIAVVDLLDDTRKMSAEWADHMWRVALINATRKSGAS